jgi:DNA adenine methylase
MPVHTIIARVGGKSKIAGKIIEQIPDHTIYVEPFIGGGSVFFKKKEAEVNVINDLEKDIYDIYKDVTMTDNIDDFDFSHPVNREEFTNYLNNKTIEDPKERLRRNLYLSKRSYSSNRTTPAVAVRNGIGNLKKNFQEIKNKLLNTIILNKDFREVIKEYDGENTFFYLDPPYSKLNPKWGYKENVLTKEELFKVLKSIKGKFLMTYDHTPENVALFKNDFVVEEIDQIYELSGKRKEVKEIIVKNYQL